MQYCSPRQLPRCALDFKWKIRLIQGVFHLPKIIYVIRRCFVSEEMPVKQSSSFCVSLAEDWDNWLESFERLHRSFETDGSRFTIVFGGGLSNNSSNQIVGIHLHGCFEWPKVKFVVPPCTIQLRKIFLSCLFRVEYGCHNNYRFGSETCLLDSDRCFSHQQELRQCVVGLFPDSDKTSDHRATRAMIKFWHFQA